MRFGRDRQRSVAVASVRDASESVFIVDGDCIKSGSPSRLNQALHYGMAG